MTQKRIHISKVWEITEQKDRSGNYERFNFTYAKKNGEISKYDSAQLTSIHAKGSTVNIILKSEVKPKKFRKVCFLSINNMKIYI